MGLETYWKKRDFRRTPEPKGRVARTNRRRFVVQEHHASMLHFDFRLEMGGVLKSWSIRKGPSLDPSVKRLAVETEDHPVEYAKFEGRIPEGEYGAGDHMIWDEGRYELTSGSDPLAELERGRMKFTLRGKKLGGEWSLVRFAGREGQWLLIKGDDEHAEPGWELELRQPMDGLTTIKNDKPSKKPAPHRAVKRRGTKSLKGVKAAPVARALKSKHLEGDVDVRVGEHVVRLTNLDRVYWPDEGLTKGDLVRYYYEVAKYILPYLKDRPLIMKRYPSGIKGEYFHQHDVNEVPEFVRTVTLAVEEGGHEVDYIVGDNLPTLLYMANLGAIERHPWHSRVRNLDRPDWFVFDLDPGKGVEFETICDLALATRDVLRRLGLESYAKTSGSRGIHVYVPVKPEYTYEEVAEFAERVATAIADENPDVATVERSLKKRRGGQIYVDHMQNARGKSVVAPYSVRPRAGASVSAPLTWEEVRRKRITPQSFTVENMMRRLGQRGDLFRPVLSKRQSLRGAFAEMEELTERPKARARGA